jgi:phosphatidylglycerol lysyltransferase
MTGIPVTAQVHADLVRRYGWHSTAPQTLAAHFRLWSMDADAGVAYVDTGAAWVAAGPPLAAADRHAAVAAAFVQAAQQAKRRAVFFAVPATLLPCGRSLAVGQEPLWDPSLWPATVRRHKSLGQQMRRASHKGVVVRPASAAEVGDASGRLRQQLDALMVRWSHHHPMPPMGFLVHLDPFCGAASRRFWIAEQPTPDAATPRVVGLASCIPIPGAHGWLLEHLLRDPAAPNGCAELLVDAAMRGLAESRLVSLGIVPLYGVQHPVLRATAALAEGLYHFRGLAAFKRKLQPQCWEPVHIACPRRTPTCLALYDVLRAFAPAGLWRFGWGILGRGSPALIRALGWVLVPWTCALASMEGEVWFPDPRLQHFWTVFDIFLAAGLFALGKRWRQGLATVLASLITADAVATFVEVLAYRQPAGLYADCVRGLAVLAPAATAVLLWNARAYRARNRTPRPTEP